jgi:hypothetical protein
MIMMNESYKEFYEDIIEIALYGGIDYWTLTYNPDTREIFYENPEVDKYSSFTLDVELVKKGLEKILEDDFQINREYRNMIMTAIYDTDAGQIDAVCADIIVQAGLFGELIYG